MTRRFWAWQQGFQVWEGIGLTPSALPLVWSTRGGSRAKGCQAVPGQQSRSTEMHSFLPHHTFGLYILNRLGVGKIIVYMWLVKWCWTLFGNLWMIWEREHNQGLKVCGRNLYELRSLALTLSVCNLCLSHFFMPSKLSMIPSICRKFVIILFVRKHRWNLNIFYSVGTPLSE